MPYLIIYVPGNEPKTIPLNGDSYVLGRDEGCDVVLNHLLVSGRHAELSRNQTGYTLEDLNSVNGTHVNGRVVRLRELEDNDSITLGIVEVVFRQGNPKDEQFLLNKNPRNPAGSLGAEKLDFSILIRGGKGEKNREVYLKASTEQVDVNGTVLTFTQNKDMGAYEIHPLESTEIAVNERVIEEAVQLRNSDQICINGTQRITFFALGAANFEFPLLTWNL